MSAEGVLVLKPARWQLWAMTLASAVGLGVFALFCWLLLPAPWRWLVAPPVALYGLVLARTNLRRLRATRVRADAGGLSFDDGAREGRRNRRVLWDDIALCVVERRRIKGDGDAGEGDGTSLVMVLKDAAGHDLFALQVSLLSRDDLARLLRSVRAELTRRNASFEVAEKWYER